MRNLFCFIALASLAEAATTYTVSLPNDLHVNTGGNGSDTFGDLRYVLNTINSTAISSPDDIIIQFNLPNHKETITLQAALPPLNMFSANSLSIDGSNTLGSGTQISIDGNDTYRGLFATQGAIDIQNLTIQNCKAQGGSGSGGGAGLGGNLFVNDGTTSLTNVSLFNGIAAGGTGSGNPRDGGGGLGGNGGSGAGNDTGGGGGGGFSGNGGSSADNAAGGGGGGLANGGSSANSDSGATFSGGGGGGGALLAVATGGSANSNNSTGGTGGNGTFPLLSGGGGGGGGNGGTGGSATANGGAGGNSDNSGTAAIGPGGGGGGGGGGNSVAGNGGNGGRGGGGGGGGAYSGTGGIGGAGGDFGGGGGGAANDGKGGAGGDFGGGGAGVLASSTMGDLGNGGDGGFGGGGGGSYFKQAGHGGKYAGGGGTSGGTGGNGGIGGGIAHSTGGGGGAGLAGGVFVRSGATLYVYDTVTISGNTVSAGSGSNSNSGAAAAAGICAEAGSNVYFNFSDSNTMTISDAIGDDSSQTLPGGTYNAGSGVGVSLHKSGAGQLILSGNNTYKNETLINEGTLTVQNNNGLGGVGTVTVADGACLEIDGSRIIPAQPLILSGSGISSNGVLRGLSGSNHYNGPVTLNSDSTIYVQSALTIEGTITGSNGIEKTGNGTLVLSGTNSYTGSTTISAGTLEIQNSLALGGTGSIAILSGGALGLENGITLAGQPISATGMNAIFCPSDSNTISSTITLTGHTSFSQFGGSLLFSGPIGDGGNGYSLLTDATGTMSIAGPCSYTGGTEINTGALALLSGGSFDSESTVTLNNSSTFDVTSADSPQVIGNLASNSSTATVLLGSITLTIGSSSDATFAGSINDGSAGGSIIKQGSGTVTFTAINLYSGGTTINDGTFALSGNGQLTTTAPVTISGSGVFDITQVTTSETIGDLISSSTDARINIGANGLNFGTSNNTTFAGEISDGGNNGFMTKQGSGTVTFTSSNSYSYTYINAGTLALSGFGGLSPTSTVNLSGTAIFDISGCIESETIGDLISSSSTTGVNVGNRALYFGTSNDQTFAGVISGAGGGIIKQGSGKETLTGVNTFSHTLFIADGTIALDGDGALNSSVPVYMFESSVFDISTANHNQTIGDLYSDYDTTQILLGPNNLTFGTFADREFDGIISGTGGVTKQGAGIAYFNNTNTYTGLTTISAGNLSVNGQISGGVLVQPGATLSGTGTVVGGGNILGTLSPGNSVGTIVFDTTGGDVTLNSGATTHIEIDPSDSSRILITGPGSIHLGNSTVDVTIDSPLNGYSRKGSFTIVNGAYTDTFNPNVLGGLNGFQLSLSYEPDFVFLNYSREIPTTNLSGNQLKITNYLNDNASIDILSMLSGLTTAELQEALNSLSPSRNSFGSYVAAQTSFSLSNLLSSHMDHLRLSEKSKSNNELIGLLTAAWWDKKPMKKPIEEPKDPKNRFTFWFSGLGQYARQDAASQNPAFKFLTGSALLGLDCHFENKGLFGLSLGYAYSHLFEHENAGNGKLNNYFASLYGNGFIGSLYISPAVWGMFTQNNNTRHVSFPNFSSNAHAEIYTWQLIPHLELGYQFSYSWISIAPFDAIDWPILWQRDYTEHGAAPFNAKQDDTFSSIVRNEAGLKFCEKWNQDWGAFIFKEKVSYVYEKPFSTGTVQASFVGTPGAFTVVSLTQNLNLIAAGFDFITAIGKDKPFLIQIGYEGEFGSNYRSNDLMFTLSKDF